MKNAKLTILFMVVAAVLLGFIGNSLISSHCETETKAVIQQYETVQRRIIDTTCPKCNGAMENGFTVDISYGHGCISSWVQGIPQNKSGSVNTEPASPIVTMRCKACGYLESYAK